MLEHDKLQIQGCLMSKQEIRKVLLECIKKKMKTLVAPGEFGA